LLQDTTHLVEPTVSFSNTNTTDSI
jgi:hypothetical protein